MIPHPVVGIALLSIVGRNHPIGSFLQMLGVHIMGTTTGLITVLTFVGLPFYINTVKAGFEDISPRLEHVSRSLGATAGGTFLRISPSLGLAPYAGRGNHVHGPCYQRIWSRSYRSLSSHGGTGNDL